VNILIPARLLSTVGRRLRIDSSGESEAEPSARAPADVDASFLSRTRRIELRRNRINLRMLSGRKRDEFQQLKIV
jgi:hypothetical protein